MNNMTIIIGLIIIAIAPVIISFIVEALRTPPETPEKLLWSPDIPARYINVKGMRLRYVETGEGPPLLLLHTIRIRMLCIFVKHL